jgi:putative ABC transport system permease protein
VIAYKYTGRGLSYIPLAWSNLRRNRRRSLSTLLVVALGVAMIVLTNSLAHGISANMSGSIINQIDGHLRIQHKDYKKYYVADQEKILLEGWQTVAPAIERIPHVRHLMPRVMLGGLMAKDDKTTTFFGVASRVQDLPAVLPDYAIHLVDGQPLAPSDESGVLLGRALARSLTVQPGDELVLLSKTVHGEQSNTLVRVRGIITFPSDEQVEQSLLLGGLGKPLANDLLDLSAGAGQLVLRLDDAAHVPQVMLALDQLFAERGLPWRAVPWDDNPVYARVVGMFNGIGGLITFVLAVMVGVITSNALLMAFFERVRELGTLRAIGMNRLQVHALLYLESAMVGLLGATGGLALGFALSALLSGTGIPIGLIGQRVHPEPTLAAVLVSVLAPLVCIVLAATLPVRAATRMPVIDALNHA